MEIETLLTIIAGILTLIFVAIMGGVSVITSWLKSIDKHLEEIKKKK